MGSVATRCSPPPTYHFSCSQSKLLLSPECPSAFLSRPHNCGRDGAAFGVLVPRTAKSLPGCVRHLQFPSSPPTQFVSSASFKVSKTRDLTPLLFPPKTQGLVWFVAHGFSLHEIAVLCDPFDFFLNPHLASTTFLAVALPVRYPTDGRVTILRQGLTPIRTWISTDKYGPLIFQKYG